MDRENPAAGLIAGTVPTKGIFGEIGAQMRQHQSGSGVAGDHNGVGRIACNEPLHHLIDAFDQSRRAEAPIRKARVVGGIKTMRIGAQLRHLREHGEPAETEVENKDFGRVHVHGRSQNLQPSRNGEATSGVIAFSAAKIDHHEI